MTRPPTMNIVYSGDILPRRGFFKSWERTRHSKEVHWFVECFAEALGVFLYTWAGVGSTAAFVVGNILGLENVGSLLGIGFAYAFGILLALGICSATSGGHFNPCVSITHVVFRGFPPLKAVRYIVFQILGGYIACLLVYAQWRDFILAAEAALTAAGRLEEVQFTATGTGGILALYAPPGAHLGLTFVNEFVTDFVLALAIWACFDPTNALVPPQAAPWVISFAYAMAIWGFATPGLAANAARDLGGRFAAMSLYGTKASGGAYAAIAALTSIPATLLAAFTYETMLMDSDRVLPRATLEFLAVHKHHRRHGEEPEAENHSHSEGKSSHTNGSGAGKPHIEALENYERVVHRVNANE
ncbi:aquaporin-like protein [Pleurotus eryngii]|uniref:Aquaporin-like protein n=1 Tax=Pleurotus eryngii TaxID=5323 RepID=A0A9P5ZZ32_PLEER|nr:aquaporin-like protein [Pleurotus eryngii]